MKGAEVGGVLQCAVLPSVTIVSSWSLTDMTNSLIQFGVVHAAHTGRASLALQNAVRLAGRAGVGEGWQ